jgi:hypothetical protein
MNINRINAQINKHLFNSFIGLTHWLTATKLRNIMGKPLMRGLGGLPLTVNKAKK